MLHKRVPLPFIFYKSAQARWRRPENLKAVRNRVNKDIAGPKNDRPLSPASDIKLMNSLEAPAQKRLITDVLRDNRVMFAPRPSYADVHRAQLGRRTDTQKANDQYERAIHEAQQTPMPYVLMTSAREQNAYIDNMLNTRADPLAHKQYVFNNLGSPTTKNQYLQRVERIPQHGEPSLTQVANARLDANKDVKRIQEYMKKVLPYLAGGAGIAGAGVLAANS